MMSKWSTSYSLTHCGWYRTGGAHSVGWWIQELQGAPAQEAAGSTAITTTTTPATLSAQLVHEHYWLIASCMHDCSLVSVDCKVFYLAPKILRAHSSKYYHTHTDTATWLSAFQLLLLLLLVHELLVDRILAALLQLARSFFSTRSYCLSSSLTPNSSRVISVHIRRPSTAAARRSYLTYEPSCSIRVAGRTLIYIYINIHINKLDKYTYIDR